MTRALDRDVDAAVEHVMSGFASLSLHPDVADCVRALQRARLRLVTLTNGSTRTAEACLLGTGINDAFELLLSVEDAGAWKPARAAAEQPKGTAAGSDVGLCQYREPHGFSCPASHTAVSVFARSGGSGRAAKTDG